MRRNFGRMGKELLKSGIINEQLNLNVDKDSGIIKNVVIVQQGVDKSQGYFTTDFLNALVEQGNSNPKGLKSRFGHPAMCGTTLGSFIGRYKTFRLEDESVVADLHLSDVAKETEVEGRGISMYDYILKMAETESDMFGNSIHFLSDIEFKEVEVNGEPIQVEEYHNLKTFIASDLVDSPAATTDLFKSSEDMGVKTAQFLDLNPQIFELISKDTSILFGFMKRYGNYLQSKNKSIDMKFLDRMKKAFQNEATLKDIDLTLESGEMVTVVTDAETPQVGDAVNMTDGSSVEDDSYTLVDGTVIVTVEGKIDSITPKEEEEEEEEEEEQEESSASVEENAKSLKAISETLKSFGETISKIEKSSSENQKSNEEAFELLTSEFTSLKENHLTLARSIEGQEFIPPGEEKEESEGIVKSSKEKREQK